MRTEHLEEIVVALLAVNNYPLEKAWKLLPGLRAAGLTDPKRVPMDIGECTVALAAAGYDRGLLTEMFAERIQQLMAMVERGALAGLDDLIDAKKKTEAQALVTTVKGVGPRVAETAWLLWTSAR
jgi:hypothetical protein